MPFAAIDVGSNTVKLTVVQREPDGRLSALVDTSRGTRLGEGIHAKRLREVAIRRTLDALAEYAAICREHRVERIAAVGTSALRDAVNRDDFVARARDIGIDVEPIAGEEEARLSFLAVRRDPLWRDAERLLVLDIGGGSTEIVQGEPGGLTLRSRVSLPLGAVRLTEAALWSDPPTVQQMGEANRLALTALDAVHVGPGPYTAVGVGGTLVNLAAVKLGQADRDPDRLHGCRLSQVDVETLVQRFAECTVEERKRIPGLDPDRADIIVGGAIVLARFMDRLRVDGVSVSCRGLRWGVLYERFGRR